MGVITMARPLPEPWALPAKRDVGRGTSPLVVALGGAVIGAVVILFVVFR